MTVIDALYRTDLVAFAEKALSILEPGTTFKPNWHHRAIGHALARCHRGSSRRLIVNQAPKTLKTHLMSICWPASLLGNDPGMKIAIICYDEALAVRIVRSIRQVLRSAWYRALFPETRIRDDKDSEAYFETTAGGEVRAISVAGGITGHGYDVIIIDDPMKASAAHSETERRRLEDLYSSAIANRWRDPARGVLAVVMQRLHVDDFTNYLLRKMPGCEHLCIPAMSLCDIDFDLGKGRSYLYKKDELLEPERLNHAVLKEMRALQGQAHYDAQYMQMPMATGGRIIDPNWFRRFATPRKHDYRVISIDPAFTEDGGNFSAAIVCHLVGDEIEIVGGEQVQMNMPSLIKWIRGLEKRFQPDLFLVEGIGAGKGLCELLRNYGFKHLYYLTSHGILNKQRRMEMVSPIVECGRVYLPEKADFVEPFIRVLGQFPYGPTDDWADSLSQLLLHFDNVWRLAKQHRDARISPETPSTYPKCVPMSAYLHADMGVW